MRRPSGAGKKALKRCESADNPMVFIAHQPQSKRQRSLHTRTLPSMAGGAFNPSLSFFHIPVCPAPPVSFPEVLLFYLLLSPHYPPPPLTRSEPALNPPLNPIELPLTSPNLPLIYPYPARTRPWTGHFLTKGGTKITMADSSLGTKFGRVPHGKWG